MKYRKLLTALLLLIACSRTFAAEPRVMIVSIDGLRPDIALTADMPNLRSLMKDGSYSFWAYTTPAAVTLPSHTSMLTGVTIERHGISGNDDNAAANQSIKVPTIFQLARARGISTACVAGKSKFSAFLAGDFVDHAWTKSGTSDKVAGQAVSIIRQHQPRLLFVHFPEVDGVGHSKGWGSRDQIAAAERTDAALGMVIDELKKQNLYDQTTIILSADHGGSGKTHGKDDDRSKFIPWMITGPEVRKNTDLTLFRDLKINTYDTFATACHVLEIPIPEGIDGKVILHAFETTDLMGGPTTSPTTQPTPKPAALQRDGASSAPGGFKFNDTMTPDFDIWSDVGPGRPATEPAPAMPIDVPTTPPVPASALHPLFNHWCALCTQAAQAATRTERGMELIQGGAPLPDDTARDVSSFELIAP